MTLVTQEERSVRWNRVSDTSSQHRAGLPAGGGFSLPFLSFFLFLVPAGSF